MNLEKSSYLGPRIRRLRRNLGLTQPDLAAALEISASYVSLIESNQRPVTAELLLRLARTYQIDLADLAGDGGEAYTQRLQDALTDPLFADLDLPKLQSADVATNFPAIAEAFLRLHSAYRAEQRALLEAREDDIVDEDDPVRALRLILAARRNHFPELEEAGEALAPEVARAGGLQAFIEARHDLRVRRMPPDFMSGQLRRHDPHHRAIFLDDTMDAATERFHLAVQLTYLSHGALIDGCADGAGLGNGNTRSLLRRTLANYTAAAVLMPYDRFQQAAVARGYDVDALAPMFGVTWETAAHRLTTLNRPGHEGIPFSLVRIDAAANVSKHHDGAGFPIAWRNGGCPLWSLYHAAQTPGRTLAQRLELPDGRRFVSIARATPTGGGTFGSLRVERAVALICADEHAGQLVFAAPLDPMPIGTTCRLCQRDRCAARALPPMGRRISPDDYHRGRAPLSYSDD